MTLIRSIAVDHGLPAVALTQDEDGSAHVRGVGTAASQMPKHGDMEQGLLGVTRPASPETGHSIQEPEPASDSQPDPAAQARSQEFGRSVLALLGRARDWPLAMKHAAGWPGDYVYLDYTYYINILEDAYGC